MRNKIDEILTKNNFIKINKYCKYSLNNFSRFNLGQVHECMKKNDSYSCPFSHKEEDPLKDKTNFFRINYKTPKGIFNIYESEFKNMEFFFIKLKNFEEFPNDLENLEHKIRWKYQPYRSSFFNPFGWIDNHWTIIVGIDYFKENQPRYFISDFSYLEFYFKTKKEFRSFEDKITKWIQNMLNFLKPKTFSEYKDPIFKFKKDYNEYLSYFNRNNKIPYLGKKIENDLHAMLEAKKFLKTTHLYNNWITLEDYDIIIKKIKKYGGKKLSFENLKQEDFVFTEMPKFAKEIYQINKKTYQYYFEKFKNTKNVEFFYKDILDKSNVMYWSSKKVDKAFLEYVDPSQLDDCFNFYEHKLFIPFSYKKRKDLEIYILDDKEYGINQKLFKKLSYNKLCFPLPKWFDEKLTKHNFIMINKRNPNSIKYSIHISDFYEYFYRGKYHPLLMKYYKKIVELEKDIFLRNGKDTNNSIHDEKNYELVKDYKY